MDGLVIIVLLGLLLASPWLFNKAWASTLRHTVHRGRNQRAQELIDRVLRFEVPGAEPGSVIDAIVDEAGFASATSLKSAVCITGWGDDYIRFELTHKLNIAASGFTSLLVVTPADDGNGTLGEYGVAEAYQFDGRAAGVEEMTQTEETIRKFVTWKFPGTRILS